MQARLLDDDLWPTITRLARRSKRNYIAVAYLSRGGSRLLPLGKGDSLLVDMSKKAVGSGQTDPNEIDRYLERGVRVFTCSNLHAKTYVFDNELVVASANVSKHSRETLIESGVLCQDKVMASRARGWIKRLLREPVTKEYVKLMKKIYNPPVTTLAGKRRTRETIPIFSRLWIVSVETMELTEQEKSICEKGEKKPRKQLP